VTYAVKEAFYTLQGEGLNAGRAAVFVRFAGCNLWNGRAEDRRRGTGDCARWCDTDFVGTDGPGGGKFASAASLASHARELWRGGHGQRPFVVCTGGEPLLQLDAPLVDALHAIGFEIAIETNGTIPVPDGIDWICVSPKGGSNLVVTRGHELKLVMPQPGIDPTSYENLEFGALLLQPMDGPNRIENTWQAVSYCLAHPRWRLSLQTHKYLGIA
jgi:7-carboxy-7-deazaguanine synthase